MKSPGGERYHHIDLLRFVFSLLIVYYHLLHANILPYVSDPSLYTILSQMNSHASMIVPCFLVLGGYFLYTSCEKAKERPYIEFALDRFFRLWPVLAAYEIVGLLFFHGSVQSAVFDLAFFRCTGISLENNAIIWYIGPFFWSTMLVGALLKEVKRGPAAILMAVIAYFSFSLNINALNGGIGRDIVFSVFSLGMFTSLGGICIGCLLGMAIDAFRQAFAYGENDVHSLPERLTVTVIEVGCLGALLSFFLLYKPAFKNMFMTIILFSVLLVCMIRGSGVLSAVCNREKLGSAGKYAYSIYIMQQVSFNILAKTLWRQKAFLENHAVLTILASVAFSAVIGVLTYHLVERPALMLYRRWKERRALSGVR